MSLYYVILPSEQMILSVLSCLCQNWGSKLKELKEIQKDTERYRYKKIQKDTDTKEKKMTHWSRGENEIMWYGR